MLELELVHELLVEAGLPPEEVDERFPCVPTALAERFHPWSLEYTDEVRDLVVRYVDALNASVPQSHLFDALARGVDPGLAQRLWDTGRTADDFRTVAAYTHAVAQLSLRPGDHPDHIDASSERAAVAVWAWLGSGVPIARVTTYIRAGISVQEAVTQHEPNLARSDTLEAVESLAALRDTPQLEDAVRWALY
ncbi:hypothetical protein [Nocardioides sp. LS1]|uniref:hypothetical protein n=1 Tax=Nocardioides sp. LS1 TaxID=1027620 RepID=UPI000F6264BE|nr:hypothetical protein [Nocardioides sp. LS1]GCD90173.1 hypothetical protein NLS1_21790 [Nocardioides sp. LS1]